LCPGWIEARKQQQPGNLQAKASHQHARIAEACREPAATEIGEGAGYLIQQEDKRQHEQRVAEAVERQQDQNKRGAPSVSVNSQ
jgi:hypothetical protein